MCIGISFDQQITMDQHPEGGSKNDLRVDTAAPVPQQARPSVSAAATGKPIFCIKLKSIFIFIIILEWMYS